MYLALFEAPLRCRFGFHRMIRTRHGSATHICGLCGGFFIYC